MISDGMHFNKPINYTLHKERGCPSIRATSFDIEYYSDQNIATIAMISRMTTEAKAIMDTVSVNGSLKKSGVP